MADIYFSDYFRVAPAVVEDYGAFDISLISDLPLFVDPFLLFNSKKPIYQQLHAEIIRYMRFLKEVTLTRSLSTDLIDMWFAFPEVRQNWFGFSRTGNHGHGLGRDFARALHRNFNSVFRDFGNESVTRTSHLEKLCLVRDGVGRDTISDFTANLIKQFLAEYTQEFALQFLHPTGDENSPFRRRNLTTKLGHGRHSNLNCLCIAGSMCYLHQRKFLRRMMRGSTDQI